MMHRRACGGLTLVEMLVVVAILAAMLGILLPALTRARTLADRSECINHLAAMGLAIDSLTQDQGGALPKARYLAQPIISADPNPPLSVTLIGQLRAQPDVFHCPGDANYLYQYCGLSYFYNFALGGRPLATLNAGYLNRSEPAEIPLLWDADNTVFPTIQGTLAVPRFHEQRNSLFGDFHVDTLADDQTPFF